MSVTQAQPTGTPAARSPHRGPSRARFIPAILLPLAGIAAALMWGFAALVAVSATADGFIRGNVPGTISAELHPGTWYLYAEGGATVRTVRVTGPGGRAAPVTMTSPVSVGYDHGGNSARQIGRFDVRPGQMGRYRVTASGTTQYYGNGGLAVGEFSVAGFMRPQRLGIAALLLVNITSGVAIAVAPAIRRSRRRSTRTRVAAGIATGAAAALLLLAAFWFLGIG